MGLWYFDNIDISTFGVYVVKDGYNDLLAYPEIKEPEANNWAEYDGLDVDIITPVLQQRKVSMRFYSNTNPANFIALITSSGYHTFKSTSLGKQWKLRYDKKKVIAYSKDEQLFTIDFMDDFPRDIFTITAMRSDSGMVPAQRYEIDGVNLQQYSIGVIEGRKSVLQQPQFKNALSRSFENEDSELYDTGDPHFEAKEIVLNCALCTKTLPEFWNNYIAFFNNLISSTRKTLTIDYAAETNYFYYKSSSGFRFFRNAENISMLFSITLVSCETETFLALKTGSNEYLLDHNNEYVIVTP